MMAYLYNALYSMLLGFFEVFPLSGAGVDTLLCALFGQRIPVVGSSWIWGTLLGTLLAFWRPAAETAKGLGSFAAALYQGKFRRHKATRQQVTALYSLLAAGGLAVMLVVLQALGLGSGLGFVGLMFLASAGLLFIGDHTLCREVSVREMTATQAIKATLFQAVALVPGLSRTGVSLGTTLNMGFSRKEAFEFAMMLTVPALAVLGLWNLDTLTAAGRLTALFGALGAAVGAYLAGRLFKLLFDRDGLNVAVFGGAALGIVSIIIHFVR